MQAATGFGLDVRGGGPQQRPHRTNGREKCQRTNDQYNGGDKRRRQWFDGPPSDQNPFNPDNRDGALELMGVELGV